jgi:hypothetical protein
MDGRDMQRRVGASRRHAQERDRTEALRRNQAKAQPGTAEECLKAGRDPARKLEVLRRGLGAPPAPPEARMR